MGWSRIPANELRILMMNALSLRNIKGEEAGFIVADLLEAQLEGRPTHGISKLLLFDEQLAKREGSPEVVRRHGCCVMVNGHKELGHIAGLFCSRILLEIVQKQGIAIVSLYNYSRYSRLKPFGRMLAENGLVSIVTNNGGPPAEAPYGSIDPILGVNPICFSFPSEPIPVVIDFSASERVWGVIRQAMLEDSLLPPDSFLDAEGNVTRNVDDAEAVLPFGQHKGAALCLALELLAGSFTPAQMGLKVTTEYDLGATFLAIDIRQFQDFSNFKSRSTELVNSIRTSRPTRGARSVRVAGDPLTAVNAHAIADDTLVEVDDETLRRLREMSKGRTGGLASTDKTN